MSDDQNDSVAASMSTSLQHHEDCSTHKYKCPGYADPIFEKKYEVGSVEFSKEYLECAGCCLAYLAKRDYHLTEVSKNGDRCLVHFCNKDAKLEDIPTVRCYARKPTDSKHVQFATDTVEGTNLGTPAVCRPLNNSHTYQIYTKDGTIPESIGTSFNLNLRLESVAVEKVKRSHLSNIWMTLDDAVLLERYRVSKEKRPGLRSFRGCCIIYEAVQLQLLRLEIKLEKTDLNAYSNTHDDQKPKQPSLYTAAAGDSAGVS